MTGLYKVNARYMKLDTANTRGHQYKLRKERACHATRRNFFTGRITNTWNSLPTAVAEAPSMDAFKARLDISIGAVSSIANSRSMTTLILPNQ